MGNPINNSHVQFSNYSLRIQSKVCSTHIDRWVGICKLEVVSCLSTKNSRFISDSRAFKCLKNNNKILRRCRVVVVTRAVDRIFWTWYDKTRGWTLCTLFNSNFSKNYVTNLHPTEQATKQCPRGAGRYGTATTVGGCPQSKRRTRSLNNLWLENMSKYIDIF